MSTADAAGGTAAALLRRQRQLRGWYLYGWASHVFPTIVTTVFMGRYLTAVAENAVGKNGRIHVLGIPIAPGSLFVYTVSASTILLVVLMPVVGAIADRTGRKREILLGFGWLAAAACTAMLGVTARAWQLGAALYVVAFVGYSCATVVNYSLLVDLSDTEERDRVSSFNWAIAYIGGGVLLAADFVLSLLLNSDAWLARISLCGAGVWWALFNVLPWRMLRGLPSSAQRQVPGSIVGAGFRQLRHTIAHIRSYPHTLAFLIAFLIYNDGIQTVTTVAAQYGDKELRLDDTVLLPAILLVQFVAFGGAIWLGRLAARYGAKRVVLGSLVAWLGLIGVAYLLQVGVAWQFYALAIALAIVLGGSQALSRSMFSRLIPAGSEAEYFGFYEISDSGTSWLGPLIFGLAYQLTSSYRSALASLVVFFVVGFVLLLRVPLRAGIEQAGNTVPARV
ncbi:MFS transporter [Jatrophihabitans telluris]|uniref:MFS transporter n=1 Tax=Jatrophihabitans telluris TaxID=2038343 RepID=A0ABY4QSU2_9ACTN|nr:MFS transporter [Jatrophihabitans telluris]UQX86672.1 MFS transporter [Jatrophihabitans telluris]